MVSSAKLVMLFIVFEILYFKNFKERIAMFVYQFKAFPQIYYLLFFYTIVVTVIACAIEMSLVSKVFSSFLLYIISFFFLLRLINIWMSARSLFIVFSTELHYYIGYI